MALAPWNVLAAGKIRTDEEEERRRKTGEKGRTLYGEWERTAEERRICKALEAIAEEIGAKNITSGKQTTTSFEMVVLTSSDSGDCVLDAENRLCFPHCRRPQSRASPRQHRSLGYLFNRRTN
jgi:hypothetical protein